MISMDTNNCRLATLAKARLAKRQKVQSSVATTEIRPQDRLSRLNPARRASVDNRLSQMPSLYRNTYRRAISGKSPAAGIKAFCNECVGWQRVEVARCTALACPLWSYRPGRIE